MIRGLAWIGLLCTLGWLSGCCCVGTPTCGGPGLSGCGSCGEVACTTCPPPAACACHCGRCDEIPCMPHASCLLQPAREIGDGIHRSLTCGGGCGEIYWDEWISDPPDACDPCDCDGHWNGHRGVRMGLFERLHFLWNGYRYYGDCETPCQGCDTGCGGCASCGDHVPMAHGEVFESLPIESAPRIAPRTRTAPTPATPPGQSALHR